MHCRNALTGVMAACFLGLSVQAVNATDILGTMLKGRMHEGVSDAQFGDCKGLADHLGMDWLHFAATLAVFPDDTRQLVYPSRTDESVKFIVDTCASQLHRHLCSKKIIGFAGTFLTAGRPGGAAVNPRATVGGILGGVIGGVAGAATTGDPGRYGAMDWARSGAEKGASLGKRADSTMGMRAALTCAKRKATLVKYARKANGQLPAESIDAFNQFMRQNVADGTLQNAEANALSTTANSLVKHAHIIATR